MGIHSKIRKKNTKEKNSAVLHIFTTVITRKTDETQKLIMERLKKIALIGATLIPGGIGVELTAKTPPANLGKSGKIQCRYKLEENETLAHLTIYKETKRLTGLKYFAVLLGSLIY